MQGLCQEWGVRCLSILKWIGADIERDRKVASRLQLFERKELPNYSCVEVIGPYEPMPTTSCPKMVVDGAIKIIKEVPELLVTDLDGATVEDVVRTVNSGGTVFLHLHGDNYFEALARIPLSLSHPKIIITTQHPALRPLCVPAFSDGSRAIVIANIIAKRVYITGFSNNEIIKIPPRKLIHPLKSRKLSYSRTYEVLAWQRYSGQSQEQVNG
ncbi:hypothetical protein IPA_04480 [Ignicoccus pacificus DSM 13166]|uniref:Uncharacterized protein n=1 Tax=Ignicoccus pacificus DSM 13166 TaxID=940294 RepID=A0A977PK33_9CREN|nr:hypothetical protein IPA_04480 [Ignicoccus pacificus DSM 13166]